MLIPPSHAMQGLFCMTRATSEAAAGAGAGNSNAAPFDFSFVDLTAGSADLDAVDPSFSFLTELPDTKVLLFRGSCNGLVLLEHREEPRSATLGYIVCNPTTKEWEAVPACGSPTLLTYPYLEDEEFISVHAYSSETGAWSDDLIDEQGEEEGQFPGWRQVSFYLGKPQPCPFVNGFLHMIVLDRDEIKVVAFDVQGKGRRMIPVPHQPDRMRHRQMCYFGESQGQLQYMTQEMLGVRQGEYRVSIWALQDYDAQEWVLKGTVDTHEIFGMGVRMGFKVVDIHQDRNVVFFTRPLEHNLVAYDMDREEVSTIATFNDQKWLLSTARYVHCF
ncbi:unnamed protein product [Urochloa decumbens]|uniref:F-box protein At3g26010-like beta-propeller domain-containing protein n=1 Tax=Urochloa decumbens TaxID=240449 RepID=A0ABC9GBM5_9POAL